MDNRPAVLNGAPAFDERLPIVRPTLPDFDEELQQEIRQIFASGMLTKGKHLHRLEASLAEYLGVSHALALSSCTIGLMLTYQALELGGEVIVPSFTFMATVHPLAWIGAVPVFVDIDPHTWNLDPDRVEAAVSPRTTAIVAVHNFGNPAAVEKLQEIARRRDLRLVFDAAHGFGSRYRGRPVGGFGDAEVFSMSPTKLVVAGEGGVVATNDGLLAEHIRIGREYGNPGDYGSEFPGLNGRLPELSALLAERSLAGLDGNAQERNRTVQAYRAALQDVPGISFQQVHPEDQCSYKDLSVLIDEEAFGLTRNELAAALAAENIETRTYHDPPVHMHTAYRQPGDTRAARLPVTERVAPRSLSLPIWSHMTSETAQRVADAVRSIFGHGADVRRALTAEESG